MLGTKLYWVNGPWRGKLAMAARPRGGDWLPDEIASWRSSGVATMVSLLEEHEERDLDLKEERSEAEKQGLKFVSFPIVDRDVPMSRNKFGDMLETLHRELAAGQNVVLHCRQGIGRTGLVAACLLVGDGLDPQEAIERLKTARGLEVPETAQQLRWINDFAGTLTTAR
jgi:protein-tyrosine phosphatase